MAVFADTAYSIALLVRTDAFRLEALRLNDELAGTRQVTTDPVLVEVLAYVSRAGSHLRRSAIELIDDLRADPSVTIVRQTPDLFDAGLDLYRRRLDKAYSLTDCMPMAVCRRRRVRDVLTHDGHFAQEGFGVRL